MSAKQYNIHYTTPEVRKVAEVADAILSGAVVLYPTDTGFTLGCQLSNKDAISRLRRIRQLPKTKPLTFLCESISNISEFAVINDKIYATMKYLIPGPYTFILPATKNVPKYTQNPKRKHAGIRVPDHELSQLLLKQVGNPIISISARISDDSIYANPEKIVDHFSNMVDVVVESNEYNFLGESTVIDMTKSDFEVIRRNSGLDKIESLTGLI